MAEGIANSIGAFLDAAGLAVAPRLFDTLVHLDFAVSRAVFGIRDVRR